MVGVKSIYNKDKNNTNYFDRVEVGGSNPSTPTKVPKRLGTFYFLPLSVYFFTRFNET